MNTNASPLQALDADPLASLRMHGAGIADLAFGSLSRGELAETHRHLALLPPQSLELDLRDPTQRQFGDYELLEMIGEGGMGVVYRARQISLDRNVAVKLLAAGPWASKEFIERFRREAQNAARMQHPNIVPIYEVGSAEEMHFFSMSLIEGPSLAAMIKRDGKLPAVRAAQLLRTIAEAVDYAHRLGVLHLDLKPANVLIDNNGLPHVADFGLARRLDSALAADNDEISGTPSYMAPEQAQVRTQKITPATDIWGLGAIGYELLTARPPFLGDSPQSTLNLVLRGALPSPARWAPDLPGDLEAIILKCMARETGERYASARELADDLGRFLEKRPVKARPLGIAQRLWRWARREPKLAATALLAFALLAGGLIATTQQWRRADTSAISARGHLWSVRAQAAQQALANGDGFHSLRPLVVNLAEMETAGQAGEVEIERERIGTILANAPQLVDLAPLPADERATSLAISPDARHFAVATIERFWGGSRHVRQYDLATLREIWSTATDNRSFLGAGGDHGAPHGGLRYTADGRFLLVSTVEQPVIPAPRRSDMIAMDARDGRVLWPSTLPRRQADIIYDDNARLAMVRWRSEKSWRWPDTAQFHQVDGWHPLGSLHSTATTLSADLWLPAPEENVWLGTRDSARIALYEVPSLNTRWRLDLPQTSLVRAWRFSHDGRQIALGSVDGAVRVVDAVSGKARVLTASPAARVQWVQFSADDRTLSALDENGYLWTWDVATGASRSAPLHLLRSEIAVARIRYAGPTLFAGAVHGADAELRYATLAPHAPFNNEAVLGTARLPGLTQLGTAFDVSLPAQRLVTASSGNLIEVWRLPASPLLQLRAAPLPSRRLSFDGRQVVCVDGDTVRVVDAATQQSLSPPLRHPEPIRFAELSTDGNALVTIAGRTVHVIDPKTWDLRGAPILLVQTPQSASFAEAAAVLVLTTSEYAGNVKRERIFRIDLARGSLQGAGILMEAVTQMEIDPQGRHALVMTVNTESHSHAGPLLIDLANGKASCQPKLVGVRNFVFAPDGRSAWFDVALSGTSSLHRWNLDTCRELAAHDRRQRETVTPVLLARHDGSVVAHRAGKQAMLRVGADGRQEAALGDAVADTMYTFALSTDGTRAAFATRNAVYLIDAHRGRRLSAPLTVPIAGSDAIIALAFSPDGTRLLGRTINGRWLFWELPRTELTVATLTRLARVLDPLPSDTLSKADLDALLAHLHQATRAPTMTLPAALAAPRPFPPVAGAEVDARFVALDLGPAINVPLVGVVWSEPKARGDRPTLAPGLQRFLGVDYRVDGGVQLSGGRTATAIGPELHRSVVVPVPGVVAKRVHVLAFMHIPMNPTEPPRAFGNVVLIGADHRETRIEIRTIRDVVTDFASDIAAPTARIAFSGVSSSLVRKGDSVGPRSNVYAVSLDVPSTVGAIHGLRFEVPEGQMEAPLFFGATVER
ncbi:MAG TPA: protein kinase [Rudaea sp.]|nr:protein kinase [Rudaea sp.]